MKAIWHKAHPILSALGVHAFALTLLCLSFVREPEPQQMRSTEGAIIEATLVSAPLQSESKLAESSQAPSLSRSPLKPTQPQQQPSALPVPSPQQSLVEDQAQSFAKRSADQQIPQQLDAPRNQPQPDPVEQQDDENPSALAQQPKPDDPFAEMRRQRAAAERQRQLEAQGIRLLQDQHAGNVQPDLPRASIRPPHALPGNGRADQQPSDLFLAAMQFSNNSLRIDANGLPPTRCQAQTIQQANGDLFTTVWIDCLLSTAAYDPVGYPVQTIDLL